MPTHVTRRRLFGAGLAAVGAALVAREPTAQPPAAQTFLADAPPPLLLPPPHPAPSPSPAEPGTPTLNRPVFTLKEYRQVVPGPAFPDNAVALTIDDGPHGGWTPQVLHILEKYHVQATFCMIGNQILGQEAVARSVVAAGHQVANHTWSHPATLAQMPADKVEQEVYRAQEKIHETTGRTPTVFRSPGGAVSPAVFAAAAKAGMIPVNWDRDPKDWTKPGTQSITSHLLAARPGDILLCHDGGGDRSQTCAALRTVIPALQSRGLQFVALGGQP
ncbi:polysaccharide deacetylase family protein [Dactylosporangium matsuzakiense]|uniref:polysaccharide deacetylase family protein n=1 Tax=Dactylosporangium matsuzakiense TaxID=53360 RepID=UPI0021C4B1AA|nr:polysaccharide deacetylase family protein [Dactylosporangium matsuzakiense]UWZ48928.1 polysaccharide deacetylase family protein [Dactylosporangium matsuzakiense]